MAKNRFEQVDERQEDAITLTLETTQGKPTGFLVCPAALLGGRAAQDQISPSMPAVDAFRSAIKLGNEVRAAVVVVDRDGLWQGDWGELFREDE